jgi:hypothetical protein
MIIELVLLLAYPVGFLTTFIVSARYFPEYGIGFRSNVVEPFDTAVVAFVRAIFWPFAVLYVLSRIGRAKQQSPR